MADSSIDQLAIIRRFAPGTPLRHAAELILQQGSGALIVIGTGQEVDAVSSGGFFLQGVEFTPQRLAELAKMDGGIVLDDEGSAIQRANVHFIPDPDLPTDETGTRFRTAERLAVQTGMPVLAVSEEGRTLAAVYLQSQRYELRTPNAIQAEANQLLTTLERQRKRLDEGEDRLTRREIDDLVTVRDVAQLIQRAALVDRLQADVDRTVVELGGEGRLVTLQAADLIEGVTGLAQLVYEDYMKRRTRNPRPVFDRLADIPTEQLYGTAAVAAAIGLDSVDTSVRPRGLRALSGVPRLPETVKDALVRSFRDFQKLLHASVGELDDVEGVGTARAQQLRTFLDRLLEKGSGIEPEV